VGKLALVQSETNIDLSAISAEQFRKALSRALGRRSIRLTDVSISTFDTWQLKSRTVYYIGGKTETPFCLMSVVLASDLLGRRRSAELKMNLSCTRLAGGTIRQVLSDRRYQTIGVTYAREDFAVIIEAHKLLERVR
jgi:hypothetical protein